MAKKRGKPYRQLGEAKQEVLNEQLFKENPEGFEDSICPDEPIVIAQEIPEMRKIVFINGRDPGCPLEFHYHSDTHFRKRYILYHGYEHELPLEVIAHLESRCLPIYGTRKNPEGHNENYISSYHYLYQCRPAGHPQNQKRRVA